jgi:hypothetical protein
MQKAFTTPQTNKTNCIPFDWKNNINLFEIWNTQFRTIFHWPALHKVYQQPVLLKSICHWQNHQQSMQVTRTSYFHPKQIVNNKFIQHKSIKLNKGAMTWWEILSKGKNKKLVLIRWVKLSWFGIKNCWHKYNPSSIIQKKKVNHKNKGYKYW